MGEDDAINEQEAIMSKTILILGGSGKIGRHATHAFRAAGWNTQQFDRAHDDLDAKMIGADAVFMGWNPVGYQLWEKELVPLHQKVARAAARAGARVILPGNVYVYGPEAPFPWTAETPHLAENPLAKLRKAAEASYAEAGAKLLILRCGDFIDTENSGNWFDGYITPSTGKGFIRYPGNPDIPHAWAFLPDAGRAAAALMAVEDQLADHEDVPFPGYTLTGRELAAAIDPALKVKPFQWGMMKLLTPVMPVLKGVFEMRYLWNLPQKLDGGRFAELVPDFEPTPVNAAMAEALAWKTQRVAA